MDELKPCPFCGNKAEIHYTSSQSFATTKFFVGCNVCGVETPRIARTRKEAIITWNRRPTPENKSLTLEKIATAIQMVCENNGCPPDKDCTLGQDCNNCIKEWLAGVGKPEQEEK